jgi:TATA-box binding protein (TBP) (component of TFIID and TFIIIB)
VFGFLQLYKKKFEIKVKNLARIYESSEEMNLYRLALKIQNEVYPPFNDQYPDLLLRRKMLLNRCSLKNLKY